MTMVQIGTHAFNADSVRLIEFWFDDAGKERAALVCGGVSRMWFNPAETVALHRWLDDVATYQGALPGRAAPALQDANRCQ